MKLQMDAGMAFKSDFDKIPEKKDLKKRSAALRWFLKNWGDKGNTMKERYFYAWRTVISNFWAALPTFTIIYYLSMNRFDTELFLGAYLFGVLLPVTALQFKMDGGYEKFAGFALRGLIKDNIDVKKFLSHPAVQKLILDQSFKDRIKFNFINALFINNLLENGSRLAQNPGTFAGSRAFFRVFLFENHIFTDYIIYPG